MNKIYKVVWSKAKQCYVVASELAKNHTRGAKSEVSRKILVTGVLTCVFSFSVFNHAFAEVRMEDGQVYGFDTNIAKQIVDNSGTLPPYTRLNHMSYSIYVMVYGDGTVKPILSWWGQQATSDGNTEEYSDSVELSDSDLSQLGITPSAFNRGGASYTAGNGITISSDNKVSVKASNGIDVGSNGVAVKAGTNVTVNSNGVSVTGNGSVADGNTGLINGDKLYDEVRSSANGNYVIQLELYNFISSFPLF